MVQPPPHFSLSDLIEALLAGILAFLWLSLDYSQNALTLEAEERPEGPAVLRPHQDEHPLLHSFTCKSERYGPGRGQESQLGRFWSTAAMGPSSRQGPISQAGYSRGGTRWLNPLWVVMLI